MLTRVMRLAATRPLAAVLVVALLAAAGGGLAALTLKPTTSTDTLVSRGSEAYKASSRFHKRFGDDAIYVLVQEPLTNLTLTSDIERVIGLEGCISGNLPKGQKPRGGPNGPCAQFAKTKPVRVVFGPGTFLNTSVTQIGDEFQRRLGAVQQQAAQAAAAAVALAKKNGYTKAQQQQVAQEAQSIVINKFIQDAAQLSLKYGLGTKIPQLSDPDFISKVVFDETKPAGTPKARFAYIFPTRNAALISVRLRPDLSQQQRTDAISLIRRATAMPDWKLPSGNGRYIVTGAPVVVGDLATSVTDSVKTLLLAALIVMALVLAVAFRARLRLLPLVVALASAGLVFGGLAVLGASLTMASIAVIPVLIGLAVDYAIQLQSRLQEERRTGSGDLVSAVERVSRRGAPTVATAAAATAAGFVALVLSPVPMVRGFGLIMVAGIGAALLCALTLGVAAVALTDRRRPGRAAATARVLGPAVRGAGEIVFHNPATRFGVRAGTNARDRVLRAGTARPGRVLALALLIAAAGWALDTQTRVESDITKLVPKNLPALTNLQTLEDETKVGGEIDVVVTAENLTDPKVISWMTDYQAALLKRYRYSAARGCGTADLCPAFSLPDLFGQAKTKAQIDALLDVVPAYFSQGVLTADRKTATLAFGIRLMPLDRQKRVVDAMRASLKPPPGVHAELAGLPVLAADANAAVASSWRRVLLGVAGLLAVALVLLLALRDRRRALVPLIPIALATGWSALVLYAMRIPLNPMSVTLGALVIAISTEFSVLLAERYRQEREAGRDIDAALAHAYRSTGAAVLASGVTAIAGFAVLTLSDIRMLRDFGAVTVVDLSVSLLGVLIVLPAVLTLAEQGRLRLRLPAVRRPRRRRALKTTSEPAT